MQRPDSLRMVCLQKIPGYAAPVWPWSIVLFLTGLAANVINWRGSIKTKEGASPLIGIAIPDDAQADLEQ